MTDEETVRRIRRERAFGKYFLSPASSMMPPQSNLDRRILGPASDELLNGIDVHDKEVRHGDSDSSQGAEVLNKYKDECSVSKATSDAFIKASKIRHQLMIDRHKALCQQYRRDRFQDSLNTYILNRSIGRSVWVALRCAFRTWIGRA